MDDKKYYDSQVGFKSIETPKNVEDTIHKLLSVHNKDKDIYLNEGAARDITTGCSKKSFDEIIKNQPIVLLDKLKQEQISKWVNLGQNKKRCYQKII